MSPYSWVNLDSDEEIIIDKHPTKWVLLDDLVAAIALVAVALAVAMRAPTPLQSADIRGIPAHTALVLGAVIFAIGMVGMAYLKRVKTTYLITSKKVHWKEGIFTYHGDPIDLANVVDQEVSKNIIEKQFGFGDMIIKTAATADVDDSDRDMGHLKFRKIPDPIGTRNGLEKAKKKRRRHAKKEEMRYEQEIRQEQRSQRLDQVQSKESTGTDEQKPGDSLW